MPVDRAPLRAAQLDADLLQPGIEGAVICGGQGRGDVDARREQLALTIQCTPPVSRAVRTCAAPLPAATQIAGGGRSSPVRPVPGSGFPDRLADRVTLPPRCGCRTLRPAPRGRQRGYPPTSDRAVDSWITATPSMVAGDVRWTARRSLSGRSRGAANRPTECPADHVDHLVDVLVRLAARGRRSDAAWTWSSSSMIDSESTAARRADVCWRMSMQYPPLDHPRDAANLPLHPRQAPDQLGPVLRVAVTEVIGCGVGARATRLGRAHRQVVPRVVAPARRRSRIIPPGGIRDNRSDARSARLHRAWIRATSSARSSTVSAAPFAGAPSRASGSASWPTATTSRSSSSVVRRVAARRSGCSWRRMIRNTGPCSTWPRSASSALVMRHGARGPDRSRRPTCEPHEPSSQAGVGISSASSTRVTSLAAGTTRPPPGDRPAARDRSAVRACERGGDGAHPRLLRDRLGVRAAYVPDPVESRGRRRRELAGLLPGRARPLPRDDHPPPEARAQEDRKLRRLRELYPHVRIKLFYARDFRALMLKYGKLALADALTGTAGQAGLPEAPEVTEPVDPGLIVAVGVLDAVGEGSRRQVRPVRAARLRRGVAGGGAPRPRCRRGPPNLTDPRTRDADETRPQRRRGEISSPRTRSRPRSPSSAPKSSADYAAGASRSCRSSRVRCRSWPT